MIANYKFRSPNATKLIIKIDDNSYVYRYYSTDKVEYGIDDTLGEFMCKCLNNKEYDNVHFGHISYSYEILNKSCESAIVRFTFLSSFNYSYIDITFNFYVSKNDMWNDVNSIIDEVVEHKMNIINNRVSV